MKEVANSIAQFVFIIMLLVTLAIWTAAASQWLSGADAGAGSSAASQQAVVVGAR